MMSGKHSSKTTRSRKRRRKPDDEEYDFAAEVKKKKGSEAKQKKKASVNLLKALLRRSNFYANSLLSVITEQQKREKRRAETALRKRKEKLKKIEAKIRKDYGKKCQDIPTSYKTFLESEENQVFFGEKPCFRVAVVVSHLVKKASVLSKDLVSQSLSCDEVSAVVESYYTRVDEILSWDLKNDMKTEFLRKNRMTRISSEHRMKQTPSLQSQPSYVEEVQDYATSCNIKPDVYADVASTMESLLDQVEKEANNTFDKEPITDKYHSKNLESENHDDITIDGGVTPVSEKHEFWQKHEALKCRRNINLNIYADHDMTECRFIMEKLLDIVSSSRSIDEETSVTKIEGHSEQSRTSYEEKPKRLSNCFNAADKLLTEKCSSVMDDLNSPKCNPLEHCNNSNHEGLSELHDSVANEQSCSSSQDEESCSSNDVASPPTTFLDNFKVPCPICSKVMKESKINEHLDSCILGGERRGSLRRKSDRPPPKNKKRAKKGTVLSDSAELPISLATNVGSSSCEDTAEPLSNSSASETCLMKMDTNSDSAQNEIETHTSKVNPWKVTDSSTMVAPVNKHFDTNLSRVGEEEEEEEMSDSSSESESEILPPTVELRRSSRLSKSNKKSYREDSDDDKDEEEEGNVEEVINDKKPAKKKMKENHTESDAVNVSLNSTKEKYTVGDTVKIKWGQDELTKLYKAKILDRCPTDDGDWTYLIHYIGWSDVYDDWVYMSDIHSVIESHSDENESSQSQEYDMPKGGSLLDEKFYLPGSSRKNAPLSMLTERNGIKFFKDFQINPAQPKLFTGGALRDYQITGYEWLKILLENGENGILADEMGLGKTIQCISIVSKLIETGITGPFLICAPMSTIQNWFQEFRRFAPKVPLLLYHGNSSERETLSLCMFQRGKRFKTRPVVITTYDILLRDHHVLQMHKWSYMILDEGHRIKNLKCKLLKELRQIQSQQKLLLTGTPLQNNLSELWSLLNFLLPEVFDDLDTFETWFDIGKLQKNQNLLLVVHKILTPFLLRRMKIDVDLQLPPKKEIVIRARLMSKQERFYRALVNRSIKELISQKEYYNTTTGVASPDAIAQIRNSQDMATEQEARRVKQSDFGKLPGEKSRESVLKHLSMSNIIMQLRKCCNHPYLIEEPCESEASIGEGMIVCSGKMMILDKILPRLKERGHKVLIFSQMTKMLDILEDFCFLRGYRNVRIDGQMKRDDRVESITNFTKDPDIFIFLLSTRAGGLGINLTAADTVILYDSDWNPQNDAQAQDRCHRIGQEKPVLIYRLVTSGTVDEQIVERASKKLALEKLIMHKDLFKGNLEQELTSQIAINPGELLQLLETSKNSSPVEDEEDKFSLSDERVEKLLDRSDMVSLKR